MAASPSREQIARRRRYLLRKLAREYGGTYHSTHVTGELQGVRYTVGFKLIRASNGEVAMWPVIRCSTRDGFARTYNVNMPLRSLIGAVEHFRLNPPLREEHE